MGVFTEIRAEYISGSISAGHDHTSFPGYPWQTHSHLRSHVVDAAFELKVWPLDETEKYVLKQADWYLAAKEEGGSGGCVSPAVTRPTDDVVCLLANPLELSEGDQLKVRWNRDTQGDNDGALVVNLWGKPA